MEGRRITSEEQHCISRCINRHWGQDAPSADPEERDRSYEKCLSECRLCG
jgi:hypothetical protein